MVVSFVSVPLTDLLWISKRGDMWRFRQGDLRGTSGLHPGRCGRIFLGGTGIAKVEGIFPQATAVLRRIFGLFDRNGDLSYDSATRKCVKNGCLLNVC